MARILVGLAVVIAAAWIPIMQNFFRSWRARHNPVSLAICGIILHSIYANSVCVGMYAFGVDLRWATIAICIVNALACGNFYLAMIWAERRFPSDRRSTPSPKA